MFHEDDVLRATQVLTIFPGELTQGLKFLCWIKHVMNPPRESNFRLA